MQAVLEAEMTEALSAEKSARVDGRQGYRSGYYSRSLVTRVGTLELRVPRDRSGLFSTALFERYQRSTEKALVSALAEMYVQGVSTRKVKEVTETLCGHSFSASSVSEMNRTLDTALTAFATRGLGGGRMAALLRAFSAQCAGSPAAAGQRRLPARAALDLRPARTGRGAARPGGVAEQVEQ